MDTVSLWRNFCLWLYENWTMVSKVTSTLHETTETQDSRRSRISAFFRRAWKAIKKMFLCSQTQQENPPSVNPESVNTGSVVYLSEEVAELMDTISFCSNFCLWLDEDWSMVSEASTTLHDTSPVDAVERNTTGETAEATPLIDTISICSNFSLWLDNGLSMVSEASTTLHETSPINTVEKNTTAATVCGLGDTGEVAAFMDTINICSNFCPWPDEDWTIFSEASTTLHETFPVERNTTAATVCCGETREVASLMDTISFCSSFCPWLDNDWTTVSEASSTLHKTSPVNTVEINTTASAIRVDSQTLQENPENPKPFPEPVPDPELDAEPKPVPDPELVPDLEPVPELEPVLDPEPDTEPELDLEPKPVPGPEHVPDLEPFPELQPVSDPESVPDPEPFPEPDPVPEHILDPEFGTGPEPDTKSKPDPVPSGLQNGADKEPSSAPGPSDCNLNNGSLTDLYQLKNELGRGSFGRVHRAVRISDGKEVAIKRICRRAYNRYFSIPGCPRPLNKEVAFMLLLKRPPVSPYVIEMYEWFDEPKFVYLVMEYPQPCVVLKEYVCSNGLLSEEIARGLMRQLVLAVQNSLDHGLVHNDLHADNILVNTKTLKLKLIDFGCAYQADRERIETIIDCIFWVLGPLLCFIVTGNPPEYCINNEDVCCISLTPSLSPECCDLINKCLKPISEWKTLKQILQHQWFKQEPIPEPVTVSDPEHDAQPEPDPELVPDPELDAEPEPVPDPEPVPGPSGLQNTTNTKPSSVPGTCSCEPKNGSLTNLYRLEDEIGCGAFGEVFKAVRKFDRMEVAIKKITKRKKDDYILIPGCSRPLLKEVAMMSLLRRPPVSPYVIEMFEWFDEPDSISFVMEYPQPCVVLLDYVLKNGLLSEEVTRGLMRQLVLALQNCLDHGIWHNDLHSGNILVNTRTMEIKLIDFGRAYRVKTKQCERIVRNIALTFASLLYFMLNGCPLIFTNAIQLEHKLTSISSLSPECCELIIKCLKVVSEWKTLEEMLQHQWFKHQ